MPPTLSTEQCTALAHDIKAWGRVLGFQQVGITDIDLAAQEKPLHDWLAAGFHGEMAYMAAHADKRTHPEVLVPGTVRVIMVRMDYLSGDLADARDILQQPTQGYISRYAVGRDYHKVLRQRLQKLADRITERIGAFGYRVFVDSAPVLEKALAAKAGLGWIGKHSLLIHRAAGSWFFLGSLYVDIPLPIDLPTTAHCGNCTACIDACPTRAIVAPYRVDARRCIAYHTIVAQGPIPAEYHRAIGHRIYGCDDCQLACPWSRFAKVGTEPDFRARPVWNQPELTALSRWDQATFLQRTEGSAIRRIGYDRWVRNIAVALGNQSV